MRYHLHPHCYNDVKQPFNIVQGGNEAWWISYRFMVMGFIHVISSYGFCCLFFEWDILFSVSYSFIGTRECQKPHIR